MLVLHAGFGRVGDRKTHSEAAEEDRAKQFLACPRLRTVRWMRRLAMMLLAVLMVDAEVGQLSTARGSWGMRPSLLHPIVFILGNVCEGAGFINFRGERNQTGDHGWPAQMTDDKRELSVATRKILDSLTRILLRLGITYDACAELAKEAHVEVAEGEFTIDNNMTRTPEKRSAYQAKIVHDNVPTEYASIFWTLSARMAHHLPEELDRLLAEHDRDNKPDMLGSGQTRLGVGIYPIGETWPESPIDED